MDRSKPNRPVATTRGMPELTDFERETYGWQLPIHGFGEEGQRRLKGATVLISRIGGLGGVVAQQLAAAGVGRLILAHGGTLRPDDLNRQLLMNAGGLGTPRIQMAEAWLRQFNPRLELELVESNITDDNVRGLVAGADIVADCAPLFQERYLLNREIVAQRKPMVECAVHELEIHLTTIVPGETPCLRCLYPELSTTWTRRFPVLGAVSGTAGALAAMQVIQCLTGLGAPLKGTLLQMDLRTLSVTKLRIRRVAGCTECGSV